MRGHAVFIVNVNPVVVPSNFEKREGADKDTDNLQSAFCTKLGFNWLNQDKDRDLRRSDWVHSEEVAPPNCNCITCKIQNENHRDSECFLLVLSSHGCEDKGDQIYALSDDTDVTLSEIIETLSDEKCKSLKGKTRILILQACRSNPNLPKGLGYDPGFDVQVERIKDLAIGDTGTSHGDGNDAQLESRKELCKGDQLGNTGNTAADADPEGAYISSPSEESDPDPFGEAIGQPLCDIPQNFLIVYPCVSGKYAFRNTLEGSWLIDDLCKVIEKHDFTKATEMNFLKILTGAAGLVAARNVSPVDKFKNALGIVHRLVKPLIFRAIADEAENVRGDAPAL